MRLAEATDELIGIIAALFVHPPAGDPELVAEIGGNGLAELFDRRARGLGRLDLFEGLFDFGEESLVVHLELPLPQLHSI